MPPKMKKTQLTQLIAVEAEAGAVRAARTAWAASPVRPYRLMKAEALFLPIRVWSPSRNGTKQSRSTAANSIPRLMTSAALSRRAKDDCCQCSTRPWVACTRRRKTDCCQRSLRLWSLRTLSSARDDVLSMLTTHPVPASPVVGELGRNRRELTLTTPSQAIDAAFPPTGDPPDSTGYSPAVARSREQMQIRSGRTSGARDHHIQDLLHNLLSVNRRQ